MGKVVVASNHGGHIETISAKYSGFLYSPNEPNELAKAILNVLSSDIYLDQKYQIKRRKLIFEKYNVQRMCEETIKIYDNLLSS